LRIPRIHTRENLSPGDSVELDEPAAGHVGRVLRLRPGDALVLFNGDGREYDAILETVDKRRVAARLERAREPATESPLAITLGQVLSRGDRMDYAIQKSVELGACDIMPLTSERCEVRLDARRAEKRRRHWQQVAISAAEQSGRCRVPGIAPVTPLRDWLGQQAGVADSLRLVLHHHSEQPLAERTPPARVTLLVGPEGGLTEDEVEAARASGFIPLALGPRVMRTETAPVAALALCQWLWGDWQ